MHRSHPADGRQSGCLGDSGKDDGTASACLSATEKARIERRIQQLSVFNDAHTKSLVDDLTDSLTDVDDPEDAIRTVYASLWNEKAFQVRDYYRLPHDKIFMGVLVHTSFADETSNGVVIDERTAQGNLSANIVLQSEEISITNPEIPNAAPDHFQVELKPDGTLVGAPEYFEHSNQVSGSVLTAEQLLDLMKQLAVVHDTFAKRDAAAFRVLDVEFKTNATGKVEIKQARPF